MQCPLVQTSDLSADRGQPLSAGGAWTDSSPEQTCRCSQSSTNNQSAHRCAVGFAGARQHLRCALHGVQERRLGIALCRLPILVHCWRRGGPVDHTAGSPQQTA